MSFSLRGLLGRPFRAFTDAPEPSLELAGGVARNLSGTFAAAAAPAPQLRRTRGLCVPALAILVICTGAAAIAHELTRIGALHSQLPSPPAPAGPPPPPAPPAPPASPPAPPTPPTPPHAPPGAPAPPARPRPPLPPPPPPPPPRPPLPPWPTQCAAWDRVAPPHDAPQDPRTKWVVHHVRLHGLGDWLAGVFSAFLFAAVLQRHLWIGSPFDAASVSFAPYDVAPPPDAWSSVLGLNKPKRSRWPAGDGCPWWDVDEWREGPTSGYSILLNPEPVTVNRACAKAWAEQLGLAGVWEALVPGSADDFDLRAPLVYGCMLKRLLAPQPAVTALVPPRPPGRVVAVHLRYGDGYIRRGSEGTDERLASCPAEFAQDSRYLAEQLVRLDASLGPAATTYRLESDDPCMRQALAEQLAAMGEAVVPLTPPPIHLTAHTMDADEEAKQLAAWFAFAASDVFVFKALCEFAGADMGGYFGARLSSWSSLAMLMGGTDTFHFLCEEPGSHGARCANGTKMAEVVEAGSQVAACDVEAANRLSLGTGHTMRHVSAESAAPAGIWSLGSFVRA